MTATSAVMRYKRQWLAESFLIGPWREGPRPCCTHIPECTFTARRCSSHSPGCWDLPVGYIYVARSCLVLESGPQSWKGKARMRPRDEGGRRPAQPFLHPQRSLHYTQDGPKAPHSSAQALTLPLPQTLALHFLLCQAQ